MKHPIGFVDAWNEYEAAVVTRSVRTCVVYELQASDPGSAAPRHQYAPEQSVDGFDRSRGALLSAGHLSTS